LWTFPSSLLPPTSRRGVITPDSTPEKPLPDVTRADARSVKRGGISGITFHFQATANSGEPVFPILSRNLFAQDDPWVETTDESEHFRPQMTAIGEPLVPTSGADEEARSERMRNKVRLLASWASLFSSGDRERRAGAASGENRSGCPKASGVDGCFPGSCSREKMPLVASGDFVGLDFRD